MNISQNFLPNVLIEHNNMHHHAGMKHGNYMGQSVKLLSDTSPIINIAALLLGKGKVNNTKGSISSHKKTSLHHRKIKDNKMTVSRTRKLAKNYVDNVKKIEEQEALEEYLEETAQFVLDDNDFNQNKKRLRHELSRYSDDVAEQFALLVKLSDTIENRSHHQDLYRLSRELISDIALEKDMELTADYNVSQASIDFNEMGLNSVSNLRKLYKDVVLDFSGLSNTFKIITKRYQNKKFIASIHFLCRALSNELQCEMTSLPKAKLLVIMKDIGNLKKLETVYERLNVMLTRVDVSLEV